GRIQSERGTPDLSHRRPAALEGAGWDDRLRAGDDAAAGERRGRGGRGSLRLRGRGLRRLLLRLRRRLGPGLRLLGVRFRFGLRLRIALGLGFRRRLGRRRLYGGRLRGRGRRRRMRGDRLRLLVLTLAAEQFAQESSAAPREGARAPGRVGWLIVGAPLLDQRAHLAVGRPDQAGLVFGIERRVHAAVRLHPDRDGRRAAGNQLRGLGIVVLLLLGNRFRQILRDLIGRAASRRREIQRVSRVGIVWRLGIEHVALLADVDL